MVADAALLRAVVSLLSFSVIILIRHDREALLHSSSLLPHCSHPSDLIVLAYVYTLTCRRLWSPGLSTSRHRRDCGSEVSDDAKRNIYNIILRSVARSKLCTGCPCARGPGLG